MRNVLFRALIFTFVLAGRLMAAGPTVDFTTFLKGNLSDEGVAVATDAQGNSYVTGLTYSTNFPVKNGLTPPKKNCPPPASCPAYIFVTKLSPTGTILSSTLIGGSDQEVVGGIAVNPEGVWIAGSTTSTNFGTHTQWGHGFWNGFVAKLTTDLSQMDWCVTFGGFGPSYDIFQGAYAIAVSPDDNSAYVTGTTESVDFPTSLYTTSSLKPYQQALNGSLDAFVVKVGPDGYLDSGYSTYLGGEGYEIGEGIAVDRAGHAYVTGVTSSLDFPILGQSHGSSEGGGRTNFVTELSPDGSQIVYSVLVGGTHTPVTSFPADDVYAIALDSSNEAYIAGAACSSDFPTTGGAFETTANTPCTPNKVNTAFVAKLGTSGQLLAATFLGAYNGSSQVNSLSITPSGDVVVGGITTSGVFPGAPVIAVNPSAGFLSRLSPKLDQLRSTTLLGAAVNGVGLYSPAAGPISVFTTGYRFAPGSNTIDSENWDAFVVSLSDTQ
jgi:hypothetical protein